MSRHTRQEWVALADQGFTVREAAEAFGVTQAAVGYAERAYGIRFRRVRRKRTADERRRISAGVRAHWKARRAETPDNDDFRILRRYGHSREGAREAMGQ